jgi:hypothetical protein
MDTQTPTRPHHRRHVGPHAMLLASARTLAYLVDLGALLAMGYYSWRWPSTGGTVVGGLIGVRASWSPWENKSESSRPDFADDGDNNSASSRR